jgi:hypothetical protein
MNFASLGELSRILSTLRHLHFQRLGMFNESFESWWVPRDVTRFEDPRIESWEPAEPGSDAKPPTFAFEFVDAVEAHRILSSGLAFQAGFSTILGDPGRGPMIMSSIAALGLASTRDRLLVLTFRAFPADLDHRTSYLSLIRAAGARIQQILKGADP